MRLTHAAAVLITLFSFQFAYSANSCESLFVTRQSILPESIQKQFSKLAKSQPVPVEVLGTTVLVHNKMVAKFLGEANGLPNTNKLLDLVKNLYKEGAFEFPLTPEGFLPAANNGGHDGGYGQNMWLRDLARAVVGVWSLPKLLKFNSDGINGSAIRKAEVDVAKMSLAMSRTFIEREQVLRLLQNIIDPHMHKDSQEGYRRVPFVRLGLKGRQKGQRLQTEDINAESNWGHKQNDALAMDALEILNSISRGDISPDNVPLAVKAKFILLASYFQRLKFYEMEDVGAWEETMGIRTSSFGLVTTYLERFNDGLSGNHKGLSNQERLFFQYLRHDLQQGRVRDLVGKFTTLNSNELKASSNDIWKVINHSLSDIPSSISESYARLFERLGIFGSETNRRYRNNLVEVADSGKNRGEDAALLHLLLYPPKRLTVADRVHIISILKQKLLR